MNEARRRIPELTLVEHELSVPLDHADPGGRRITVFARELIGEGRDAASFPLLVFFQGGPGSEATRTPSAPTKDSWLSRALEEYRVLLLDQRGTGRSTPMTARTVNGTDAEISDYLRHFRADSISSRDVSIVCAACASHPAMFCRKKQKPRRYCRP